MADQIAELEQRLETGWQMCKAETDHNRRVRLEDYWLRLLAEYEQAVDAARSQDERWTA